MVEVRGNPLIISGLVMLATGTLSYYSFMRGEMDIAMISAVLFFASMALSAYLVLKFSQKKTLEESIRKLQERMVLDSWSFLSFDSSFNRNRVE